MNFTEVQHSQIELANTNQRYFLRAGTFPCTSGGQGERYSGVHSCIEVHQQCVLAAQTAVVHMVHTCISRYVSASSFTWRCPTSFTTLSRTQNTELRRERERERSPLSATTEEARHVEAVSSYGSAFPGGGQLLQQHAHHLHHAPIKANTNPRSQVRGVFGEVSAYRARPIRFPILAIACVVPTSLKTLSFLLRHRAHPSKTTKRAW